MKERFFNKPDQPAQSSETEESSAKIIIPAVREHAGTLLSMDQYAPRHSTKEPQQFFTLSEAVEYFGRDAQVERAFQEINEKSSARQKENQSIRKAS